MSDYDAKYMYLDAIYAPLTYHGVFARYIFRAGFEFVKYQGRPIEEGDWLPWTEVSRDFEFDEEINSQLFDEAFDNPLEFAEEFNDWLGLDEEFND